MWLDRRTRGEDLQINQAILGSSRDLPRVSCIDPECESNDVDLARVAKENFVRHGPEEPLEEEPSTSVAGCMHLISSSWPETVCGG